MKSSMHPIKQNQTRQHQSTSPFQHVSTSFNHQFSQLPAPKLPTIPTAHQASRNGAQRCCPGRSLLLPDRKCQKFGVETQLKIVSCKTSNENGVLIHAAQIQPRLSHCWIHFQPLELQRTYWAKTMSKYVKHSIMFHYLL